MEIISELCGVIVEEVDNKKTAIPNIDVSEWEVILDRLDEMAMNVDSFEVEE